MPRYYFHFLEAKSAELVRDSAGLSLANVHEAQREAIRLAQDISRHSLKILNWQIVVADASASVVMRVPLSKVRPRKFAATFDLIHRIVIYEPRFRPYVFTGLLTAVIFALAVESLLLEGMLHPAGDADGRNGVYRLTGETTRLYGTCQRTCDPAPLK